MKKRVKMISGIVLALMLLTLSIPVFARSPADASQWYGNVGYGDEKVAENVLKNNDYTLTYLEFTGAPERINIILTGKLTNGVVASATTTVPLGAVKYASTGAVRGQRLNLIATREHLFDQILAVRGMWRP